MLLPYHPIFNEIWREDIIIFLSVKRMSFHKNKSILVERQTPIFTIITDIKTDRATVNASSQQKTSNAFSFPQEYDPFKVSTPLWDVRG